MVSTPVRAAFIIFPKEYLFSKNLPAIKTAGMYAIIYPNPYCAIYRNPPPSANTGKTNSPINIYIIVLVNAILLPKVEQININVGICGIKLNV